MDPAEKKRILSDLILDHILIRDSESFEERRILLHNDIFSDYPEIFLSKVKLSTLLEVMKAADEVYPLSEIFSEGFKKFESKKKDKFNFDYEERRWCGTVINAEKRERGSDGKIALRRYITLKLPNDHYVYTSRYEDPDNPKHLDMGQRDFQSLFYFMYKNLPVEVTKYDSVKFVYNRTAGRIELYVNYDIYCFHIGFEYGVPNDFKGVPALSGMQLEKFLADLTE